jgi:hypothetical protein
MEGATEMEGATAMDGATVTAMATVVMDDVARRRWTARRQLEGKGRHDSSSTVMDGEGQRKHNGDGNGWRDDDSTVMDSGARRRWTERGQLNGNGQRVGDTTTMDDEEGMSATAMSTRPTMEATKASAASRH